MGEENDGSGRPHGLSTANKGGALLRAEKKTPTVRESEWSLAFTHTHTHTHTLEYNVGDLP